MVERTETKTFYLWRSWSWGGGAEKEVLGHEAGSRSKVRECSERVRSFKMMPERKMQILENPKRYSLERSQRELLEGQVAEEALVGGGSCIDATW